MNPRVKAGVAVGFMAMLGLIAYGVLTPEPSSDGLSVTVPWPGGEAPPDARCVLTMGTRASVQTLEFLRLRSDAGPQCGITSMCASPSDEPEPDLPGEVIALTATQVETAYDGGPMFFAALTGHPALPCACSTGADCEHLGADGGWEPAPLALNLNPGTWRGSGCITKVCVEPQANICWPPECPEASP